MFFRCLSIIIVTFLPYLSHYSYTQVFKEDWENWIEVLEKLPDWDRNQCKIEGISGGLSNQNYKLTLPSSTFFVRKGSAVSNILGLNSQREYENTKIASAMGIAPSIALYDPIQHLMISTFIPSVPFEWNDKNCLELINLIKCFHCSKMLLSKTFSPFDEIHNYAQKLKSISMAAEWEELFWLDILGQIEKVLPNTPLCPCHLDLHKMNFLDDGNKIWLIDWEYAAMSTPLFDLSTWISADNLSESQIRCILNAYDSNSELHQFAELYLNVVLCDIRWGLWSLIQKHTSKVDFDYQNYADYFFSNAKQRVKSNLFEECLDSLRIYPS